MKQLAAATLSRTASSNPRIVDTRHNPPPEQADSRHMLRHIFRRSNWDESPLAAFMGHRAVRATMAQAPLRALVDAYPKIRYQYLGAYLAAGLPKAARREILLAHYRYLMARVDQSFFARLLQDGPVLWGSRRGNDAFAIRLSFTGQQHYEGDLLLEFQHNGTPLYRLSFTIAPGPLTGAAAPHAILVARIQGVRGRFEAIRHATKSCLDIAPQLLLLSAVQGIAKALQIEVIAGIRNSEQITFNTDGATDIYFDYDEFWEAFAGIRTDRFYLIPVPFAKKPIQQINTVHRRRTRLKRRFKEAVAEDMARQFADHFMSQR